jgi:hypothetical protein
MSLTGAMLATAADGAREKADDGIRTHDLRHGKATL